MKRKVIICVIAGIVLASAVVAVVVYFAQPRSFAGLFKENTSIVGSYGEAGVTEGMPYTDTQDFLFGENTAELAAAKEILGRYECYRNADTVKYWLNKDYEPETNLKDGMLQIVGEDNIVYVYANGVVLVDGEPYRIGDEEAKKLINEVLELIASLEE